MIDCTATSGEGIAPPLAEEIAPSPGGVDMRSGQLLYTHQDLGIGGDNGIALTRMFTPPLSGGIPYYGPFGSLTHNLDIFLDEDRIQTCEANYAYKFDYQVYVAVGSRTQTFRSGYDPAPDDFMRMSGGEYSKLTFEYKISPNGYRLPTRYTLTTADGTQYRFQDIGQGYRAKVEEVVKPDGTRLSFTYDAGLLRQVVSNRGYALKLEYQPIGVDHSTTGINVVTKACVLNLALVTLPSATSPCPPGAPSSTYSYANGEIQSYVDQGGVSTLLGPHASALYRPGESIPYQTNVVGEHDDGWRVSSQSFADGRSFSYAWVASQGQVTNAIGATYNPIMGGSYTDAQARKVTVKYEEYKVLVGDRYEYFITAGPTQITDELGRKKNYGYGCGGCPMVSAQDPGGNARLYTYGQRSNIVQIERKAQGLSLPSIIETKEFNCYQSVCGAKPTKITDGRGMVTEYDYNTTHGGLLKETGPADSSGVRPQKRYAYAERYALLSDGASGVVQAASPVWVLASEQYCRTSAADASGVCAGGSGDLVTTTYEYGPEDAPNNLLLRGVAVTSGGQTLRTCFDYDFLGRKLSETKPSAQLASCS